MTSSVTTSSTSSRTSPRADHEVVGLDAPHRRPSCGPRRATVSTAADDERIFVTTCPGRIDDPEADCTIAAHDARTGAVVWTRALLTYTEYVFPVGDRLLVQSFPDAENPSFLLLDAATGTLVDDDLLDDEVDYLAYASGDDQVITTGLGGRPADDCSQAVALHDLDGAAVWSTTVPSGRDGFRPRTCAEATPYDTDSTVVLSLAGSLVALDRRTGEQLWRRPRTPYVQNTTRSLVIVQDDATRSTVALSARTGEERWRWSGTGGGWYGYGDYVATNTDCSGVCTTVVLDARSGTEVLRVPGVPKGFVAPRRETGRTALMTRIDDPESYRARYGYVVLPALD